MSEVAKRFLAQSKKVYLCQGTKEYEIKQRTIRHNLEFINVITNTVKEGYAISGKEMTPDLDLASMIQQAVQTKLEETARLLIPEVDEEAIFDSLMDEWAHVIEVYKDLNFSSLLTAFRKIGGLVGVANKITPMK